MEQEIHDKYNEEAHKVMTENVVHSFFNKNKVYKNAETQLWWNLENIFDAEIDRIFNCS